VAPRPSNNNITVDAILDRANAQVLLAALPLSKDLREQLADTQA